MYCPRLSAATAIRLNLDSILMVDNLKVYVWMAENDQRPWRW